MSATSGLAPLLTTLNATSPHRTPLFPSPTFDDSSSVQTLTFGMLSAVLAVGSLILAYLQLVRMRRERLRVAERDCEMQ
ncbi:hypothetical protein O988_06047 [Pseudogymnoascus sp. VKM F-3808]|nr:hypothetical protein O988_06047 [Pseudogymnoascus sp. VKM F-3808]